MLVLLVTGHLDPAWTSTSTSWVFQQDGCCERVGDMLERVEVKEQLTTTSPVSDPVRVTPYSAQDAGGT